MWAVNELLWVSPHLNILSCTTKFCFCFFPTAGNCRGTCRGKGSCKESRPPPPPNKSIFCSSTVDVFLSHMAVFLCFLGGYLTAAVTVAFGFSAVSGSLLCYFLINSNFDFLTPSIVAITSWSQAPSDHPRRHFRGMFVPTPPCLISWSIEHAANFSTTLCYTFTQLLFWLDTVFFIISSGKHLLINCGNNILMDILIG